MIISYLYVCVHAEARRVCKKTSDLPELELPPVVSHLIRVLRTKLRASARTASAQTARKWLQP